MNLRYTVNAHLAQLKSFLKLNLNEEFKASTPLFSAIPVGNKTENSPSLSGFLMRKKELMAHYIDFWRGNAWDGTPMGLRQALTLGWGNRNCVNEGNPPNDKFNKFSNQVRKLGENK